MEQRSTEWFESRLGVFTAGTCFKTIMHGRTDGKTSLVLTKIAEVLSGEWREVSAPALSWGRDNEAAAASEYEFYTGNKVDLVGILYHPDSPLVGCSPDGLIGDDGGIEIKCPETSREHVRNLVSGINWKEYGPQVQGCMWVTGRQWWDFVSFDPRMPPEYRTYIERIERNEKYIEELSGKVWAVIEDFSRTLEKLKAQQQENA